MPKPNQTTEATSPAKKKPQRLGEVAAPSELPEYIKGDELSRLHPFTIFGVTRIERGQYGPKFHFDVAYKIEGQVNRRVLTLSVDRKREAIATAILQNGPIVGCRIIKVNTSPTTTYWQIIDVDDPLPEEVSAAAVDIPADEIPF